MSERYCEHNRERDSCGNNNCPYCKVESLQKELEEVKEKLTLKTLENAKGSQVLDDVREELEISKKLYAKKCDQHMETEQKLESAKARYASDLAALSKELEAVKKENKNQKSFIYELNQEIDNLQYQVDNR